MDPSLLDTKPSILKKNYFEFFNTKNILPQDGETYWFDSFFNELESNRFFQTLIDEIPWKQSPIIIFGKSVMQPRLTAWFGDSQKEYRYSGITLQPEPWTPTLLEIKQRIESVAQVTFNGALLNLYRDEKDSMGWHRDNEKELGIEPTIGSVSFGASRKFQFKHIHDKTMRKSIELTHGSFLLMRGKTQQYWLHCIPKETKVHLPRINITFRVIY